MNATPQAMLTLADSNALELLRTFPEFRYALYAGLAIATLCSLLSVLVVLKRMAFIGQGVSHAGFGGIGTAVFFGLSGWSQDLVVLGFCVAAALLMAMMIRRGKLEADSAIGILLVAAMAWGVFIDDFGKALLNARVGWYLDLVGPSPDLSSYERLLFGSILQVTWERMWFALAVSGAVLGIGVAYFKEVLFYSFDEEVSTVYGVPAGFIQLLVLVLLAVTIVISVRLAGFVLVSALLVIPGATALQLSRRLSVVFLIAWLVGVMGMTAGLLISLELGEFSTGPCIVGVLCVLFVLANVLRWVMGLLQRRGAATA